MDCIGPVYTRPESRGHGYGLLVAPSVGPLPRRRRLRVRQPKPLQRPRPPIITGGRSGPLLRVTAEHADLWNIPGGDIDDAIARSALLDRYCVEIGRDPASITRSMFLPVSYDQPAITREAIGQAVDAGFGHLVLGLSDPYPVGVAQWVVDELVATV